MTSVLELEVVETASAKNVIDRSVRLHHNDRVVPGVVLAPEDAPAKGLVLVGHGGVGQKRDATQLYLGRVFARHHGLATAIIDAPKHGERVIDGEVFTGGHTPEFRAMVADPQWNDVMVDDWHAMHTATASLLGLAPDAPLGYWGMSMGCHFGVPYIASEPRVRAAVLGLFPGYKRHLAAAQQITCPLIFVVQWHDELFEREDVLSLYDAFVSRRKKLIANPGHHSSVPRETFEETIRFLADELSAPTDR